MILLQHIILDVPRGTRYKALIMWRMYLTTHNGRDGWAVRHTDGRVAIEWTDAAWLARDVRDRLNLKK
jgi:hypothetical protein